MLSVARKCEQKYSAAKAGKNPINQKGLKCLNNTNRTNLMQILMDGS